MPRFDSATVVKLAARRKTARKFERTPINFEDIQYCIRAAIQAPSGANKQPWRFVVVDNEEAKAKVRTSCEEQEKRFHEEVEENLRGWFKSKGITWKKQFLTDAPMLLAVFSDRKMPYATESTWLAIGYILLALEERSLSTLTYTPSYPDNVRAAFAAPEEYRLETILPIGHSADTKPKEERQPPESFIHRNHWNPHKQ
jgi:nitroreductase